MDHRLVILISAKEIRDLLSKKVYWFTFTLELIIVLGVIILGIAFAAINNPMQAAANSPDLKLELAYSGNLTNQSRILLENLSSKQVLLQQVETRDRMQNMIEQGEILGGLYINQSERWKIEVDLMVDETSFYSGVAEARLQSAIKSANVIISSQRFDLLGYGNRVEMPLKINTLGREILPIDSPDFAEAMYLMVVPLILLFPILISANMMADSIVGEKETGTLGILMASPVSKLELIMGKTLPILLLANVQFVAWIFLLEFNVMGSIVVYNKLPIILVLNLGALAIIASSLLVSAKSKSSRESNLYLTLLIIMVVFPLFVGFSNPGPWQFLGNLNLVKILGRMASSPRFGFSEVLIPVALLVGLILAIIGAARISLDRLEPPPSK